MIKKNVEYWEKFYQDLKLDGVKMPPSQFAAFCKSEFLHLGLEFVVEIAAGDGRDSIFFSQQGLNVVATDKSSNAVSLLKDKASNLDLLNVEQVDAVNGIIPRPCSDNLPCAYVARFFIHTLTDEDLNFFFANLSRVLKMGDYFFAEYRNINDKDLVKVTPNHFRNFFTSSYVNSVAQENGITSIYEVEGKGFAKWGLDDAEVTRQIFIKKDYK